MATEGSSDNMLTHRRRVAETLLDATPRIMRLVSGAAQSSGGTVLSMAQLRVLAILAGGRRLPSEVARELGISPATASELVELLVRRGLVERHEQPDDRRLTPLELTAAGANQLEESRARSVAALEALLARLSAEELEHLGKGLSALLSGVRVERMPGDADGDVR
jgi:DNA-binding MarR family transcriptional regulator